MLNIINKLVKGIKMYVRYFGSIKNDDNRMFYTTDDINENGYIIRQNTNYLLSLKASFCCCQIMNFEDGIIPFITTDGLFNEMTEESQRFLLQHELGHFNLHQEILLNNTGLVRNDKIEFEADEYAMSIVGKDIAIKALKEMKETISILNFGVCNDVESYKELDRRIENLMNKN